MPKIDIDIFFIWDIKIGYHADHVVWKIPMHSLCFLWESFNKFVLEALTSAISILYGSTIWYYNILQP